MAIIYTAIIVAAALVSITVAMSGMPGSFLLWLVIFIIALIEGFEALSPGWIAVFFAAAALTEIFEYLSSLIGTRRMGGTASAMKGALLGGLAGAVILSALVPLWGFLAGVFLGTFTGAFIGEYNNGRDFYKSSKAGAGALAGRVIAAGFKVLLILVMASYAIVRHIGFF